VRAAADATRPDARPREGTPRGPTRRAARRAGPTGVGGGDGDPCLRPRRVRAAADATQPEAGCGTAAGTVPPLDSVAVILRTPAAADDGILWCCLPQLTFLQDHYCSRMQPHRPGPLDILRDQIEVVLRRSRQECFVIFVLPACANSTCPLFLSQVRTQLLRESEQALERYERNKEKGVDGGGCTR
jgi:hypothetical protein